MLYDKYVKMHIKTSAQYKANRAMLAISTLVLSISELLSIYLLFLRFESVGYWGFYEAALMFGAITAIYSTVECFGRGFDEFANIVRAGELDRLLIRPVNIYYQLFGHQIEFTKIPKALFGIGVCIFCLIKMNIAWTFAKVVVLLAMFACGCCVILGVMLIGAGISIFTIENLEFINIFTNGAKELAYYPIDIHNKIISRIFTFVVPIACFNYLPLSFIMGYGALPQIVYALSPFIGILFIIPCILFFNWAIKKYQGSGT